MPSIGRVLVPVFLVLWSPSAIAVDGEGPFAHIRALGEIAARNGGNREAGTPGYDASAEYVAETLQAAGYDVRFETFEFPVFKEKTPPVLGAGGIVAPDDSLRTLIFSGAGDVVGPLRPVDLALSVAGPPPASTSGCEPHDFTGFPRGAIALVRRGTCMFRIKVANAVAAGASAVIIMNEGTEDRTGRFTGRLSDGEGAAVPVVGLSYAYGVALAARDAGTPIRLKVDVTVEQRVTRNVLADSRGGDPARTVVIGAHLDSVDDGPGLNDNGSGVAATLEAALRLAGETFASRLRFAFWSAEEFGVFGSAHHVATLDEEARRNILLYVNLDMVGSVNFGRFIDHGEEPPEHPAGIVRGTVAAWFESRGLAVRLRGAGDRPRGYGSDDIPFAAEDIPTLSLHTGAGRRKDEDGAALFGGTAGEPFDPCYHDPCDGLDNVDRTVLEQMTDALTEALRKVAAAEG